MFLTQMFLNREVLHISGNYWYWVMFIRLLLTKKMMMPFQLLLWNSNSWHQRFPQGGTCIITYHSSGIPHQYYHPSHPHTLRAAKDEIAGDRPAGLHIWKCSICNLITPPRGKRGGGTQKQNRRPLDTCSRFVSWLSAENSQHRVEFPTAVQVNWWK